jgi:hypothetical protein
MLSRLRVDSPLVEQLVWENARVWTMESSTLEQHRRCRSAGQTHQKEKLGYRGER